jgi:hypothetical protein
MLRGMPRPLALLRAACVVAVALVLVACGPAGPTVPPQPVYHSAPTPARSFAPDAKYGVAMIAKFASDPLVLHVVQTTNVTASDDVDSLKVSDSTTVDVSNGDMKIHTVTKAAGKTTKLDAVVVGTSVYAREAGRPWRKQPRSAWQQSILDTIRSLNPIRDPAQLEYVGLEAIDKQKLHHLRALQKFPFVMADGQRGTYEKFDVWVEEDGTPVLAKGKILMIGAYGIEVKGTQEMRFSKFGGKIKITAPKL